jgi:rhamnosyltransferase subunit B
VTGNVGFGWERADRTLLLTSPTWWPRPPDWPADVVMTGFTVWDGGGADLPDDLARFLDHGAPPVLVTLGTSAATNAQDAFDLVAAAVEDLGHRPLLLVGNERNRAALAGRDDTWTFAPLPAVLSRCRAVVHAGGHGSTAAALHAGVPQVAMPQGFDQVAQADRLVALGLGAALPFRRRRPDRLRRAVEVALADPVAARARTVADRVGAERGPATAADELEDVLAGRSRT